MDINLVQHAKDYIDDLAKGINPLTQEEVGDNDVVNNVKISRCLFFVSDVLGEVIENGGIGKVVYKKSSAFSADAIDLSKIEISPVPINVSTIVKNINEQRPDDMDKLKVTAVTSWLVDINLLSVIQINNKNHKTVTAEGTAMGILQEKRQGAYGEYYNILYSDSAQQFIVDNLSSIVDGGYNSKAKKNSDRV
ncbi:MAG: hypothetical protein PUE08_00870 [Eubacteriales bacterium]|nr:hypothetical protein [Eubacteriales bacterium]